MSKFTVTDTAKSDLKEIGRYTKERWGKEQRNSYLTLLYSSFANLAASPMKGLDCGDVLAGYRKFYIGSHVIYYRVLSQKTIEIVRIFHCRMDAEARLLLPQ